MLPADEAVVVVVVVCAAADVAGVAGVGADTGAFCSCSRAAGGGALTSAEAAFEAMGVDIGTWTFDYLEGVGDSFLFPLSLCAVTKKRGKIFILVESCVFYLLNECRSKMS